METPESSKGDVVHALVKGTVGSIPLAGGLVAEIFGLIVPPPNAKKHQDWMRAVTEAIERIPQEKRTEPNYATTCAAAQSMIFAIDEPIIKSMYQNLLSRAINKDTKSEVHPSFVEMVKQLCPDEALILNTLRKAAVGIPTVSLEEVVGKDRHLTPLGNDIGGLSSPVFSHFTDIAYLSGCQHPENICSYMANLDRLGIGSLTEVVFDTRLYASIEDHPFVRQRANEIDRGPNRSRVVRNAMILNAFGKQFIKICT